MGNFPDTLESLHTKIYAEDDRQQSAMRSVKIHMGQK